MRDWLLPTPGPPVLSSTWEVYAVCIVLSFDRMGASFQSLIILYRTIFLPRFTSSLRSHGRYEPNRRTANPGRNPLPPKSNPPLAHPNAFCKKWRLNLNCPPVALSQTVRSPLSRKEKLCCSPQLNPPPCPNPNINVRLVLRGHSKCHSTE
jgi:hypothetical protein